MKKILMPILLIGLLIPLWASGSQERISRGYPAEPVRIALLNGPSGIGLINLKSENPFEGTPVTADTQIMTAPKVLLGQMLKEEWDAAVLPANMAALLYNKGIGYKSLAVTGMGNLYLVANNEIQVSSMADLAGQTLHIPGKNTTPDLITQILASQHNISLQLDYSFNPADLAKALAAGIVQAAVLPEPLATIALKTGQDLYTAADMQELWKDSFQELPDYPLTVLVVKTEFADSYPDLVDALLQAASDSLDWVSRNPSEASSLVKEEGFTLPPPIVRQAIPRSNYVFLKEKEMSSLMTGYFEEVMKLNPSSIGGSLPKDGFYY